MPNCIYCNFSTPNNLGGQLTNHLKVVHQRTLADYVIETEFQGKAPICACGLCNEMPLFNRGTFKRYAKGHSTFEWRKKNWIKVHGNPRCMHCAKAVDKWNRGKPNNFCSPICMGKETGFSKPEVQEKIIRTVLRRYGVDNVSKLDSVKEKLSRANKGQIRQQDSEEIKKKKSEASKRKWQEKRFHEKTSKSIKLGIQNNPKELKRRSKFMKERMQDPDYVKKLLSSLKSSGRFSKVHVKWKEALGLERLGFASEQVVVGRYRCDEVHHKKKIIIEINGDYVHANPKFYKANDLIQLPKSIKYTAQEKWEADAKKIAALEAAGYKVLVIWESDDPDETKTSLKKETT